MDEKIENAEIKIKSPFMQKVENYFYHYKWHTIVALFLIFAIVICSLQMCSKVDYDVHIMYAGGKEVKKNAASGDISEFQKLNSSLLQYAADFNEDGASTLNLLTLFIPSEKDLEAMLGTDGKLEANTVLISENSDMLEQNMLYSEYIVCLLSEELFLDYCAKDLPIFAEIKPYTNGNDDDYEFLNQYGIKLSSTELYSKAGMMLLPENTVICIRNFSEVSSRFNRAENQENYRRSTELLRTMLKNG